MMGMFDEFVGGAPDPNYSPPPPPPPTPAVIGPDGRPRLVMPMAPQGKRGMFDEFAGGPPSRVPLAKGDIDWSQYGKPRGELKQWDPSFTERAKSALQDAILAASGSKPNPSMARNVADTIVTGAGFTPAGAVLAGGDLVHDIKNAHYGRALLDAFGVLPGVGQALRLVQRARGELPMTRMADTPTRTVDPKTGAVNDELINSARGHYNAVATAPIDFHPSAMPNFTDAARVALQLPQHGAFTPEAAKGVHDLLARWKTDFSGNRISTPHDFDVLRQQLRAFGEGPDSAAGARAADFIDQFLSNPPQGSVLRAAPGALDLVRESLANARGDYRAGKTGEAVEYSIDRAGTRAGGANSGLNVGNTTRQAVGGLADPPLGGTDKIFGATYPERQALRDVNAGDWWTNKQRYIGNRMGGGGGFVGSFGGGIAGHIVNSLLGSWGVDPVTATGVGMTAGYAWPKVGEAFRRSSNERTVKAAEDAVDLIRRNSPLYRTREAASPDIVNPMAMTRDAIAYAMMPPATRQGQSVWDTAHVPYDNRDATAQPDPARNTEPTMFGGWTVPDRIIVNPPAPQRIIIDQPAETWDPNQEQQ